jgi:dTDP-glucose 4,6-dehydratase/UDP-glucose 4-epimerase
MKILIIGSKGFIGSHCKVHFTSKGHDVTGCDIHETDNEDPNYLSLKSISGNFNELFKTSKFDVCINAAGSAHVSYSFEFPEKDFELNVSLVIDVLGALKNNAPDCRFINFSSAAVYGNPQTLPISEDFPVLPLSPYGYHKLLSENLLLEYHRFFQLKTCSLRVFSAYGEGLKKQLFWDVFSKSRSSDQVTLYGTGLESRDFIYIKDLVSIVELIIQKSPFKGDVYNVANGAEITIKAAAELMLADLGWKGTLDFSGEEKQGDPRNWRADIRKIKSFGYIQQYTFEEGIKRYCQWLKDLK